MSEYDQPNIIDTTNFWPVNEKASRKELMHQIGQMNYRLAAQVRENKGLQKRVTGQAAHLRQLQGKPTKENTMSEYELHTQGARHSFEPHYDGNDPDRNKPYALDHDAVAEQMCLSAGLTKEQTNNLLSRLNGPLHEARRQIAALTEDYKDLESQLAAVGAGGVSAQPLMVNMGPPATSRDRWMYEQGRLAERDPRSHTAQQGASHEKA